MFSQPRYAFSVPVTPILLETVFHLIPGPFIEIATQVRLTVRQAAHISYIRSSERDVESAKT